MFESPRMPKKIVNNAAKADSSPNAGPSEKLAYTPPRVVKLQPGTEKYERAKAAFDLLLASKDNPQTDPERSSGIQPGVASDAAAKLPALGESD